MTSKSNTKILGVIGHPISHSLSPIMHNEALSALNLPYVYQAFDVSPKQLKAFVNSAPKKGIVGFNVTIPHKQKIIPYLDKLSKKAKLAQAVNTVIIKSDGTLLGDNTDGDGYLQSLIDETKFSPQNKKILILGSGGASLGIAVSLASHQPKLIHIANRTEEKALHLSQYLHKHFQKTLFTSSGLHNLNPDLWNLFDLVINTTSMGMKGIPCQKFHFDQLSSKAIISDIVYNPKITPILKQALKQNRKVHYGLGMLLHQGAISFKKWTKKTPPISIMRKALADNLS